MIRACSSSSSSESLRKHGCFGKVFRTHQVVAATPVLCQVFLAQLISKYNSIGLRVEDIFPKKSKHFFWCHRTPLIRSGVVAFIRYIPQASLREVLCSGTYHSDSPFKALLHLPPIPSLLQTKLQLTSRCGGVRTLVFSHGGWLLAQRSAMPCGGCEVELANLPYLGGHSNMEAVGFLLPI